MSSQLKNHIEGDDYAFFVMSIFSIFATGIFSFAGLRRFAKVSILCLSRKLIRESPDWLASGRSGSLLLMVGKNHQKKDGYRYPFGGADQIHYDTFYPQFAP